jgi:hypothetical protein
MRLIMGDGTGTPEGTDQAARSGMISPLQLWLLGYRAGSLHSVLALTPSQPGAALLGYQATYVDTLPPPSSVLHRRGCPSSSWKPVTTRDFGDPRGRSSLCQSSAACWHWHWRAAVVGEGQRRFRAFLPVISTPPDGVTTWNAPHRLRRRAGAVADGSHPGTIASNRRCLPIGASSQAGKGCQRPHSAGNCHRGVRDALQLFFCLDLEPGEIGDAKSRVQAVVGGSMQWIARL